MKKIVCVLSTVLFAASLSGQTILINPNGDGGFENGTSFAANGWTSVNYASTSNNNWCITSSSKFNGTYGFAPTGSRAAIISDNNGTNWTYSTAGKTGATHLYRNVTFPAGETNIQLSFRWNGSGEAQYDVMYVYLAPTSRTPVTGTPSSNTSVVTGWTGTGTSTLVGEYSLLPAGMGTTSTVSLPASLAGTTQRLVFTWKNDGSGGTRPPAALDDISLTSSGCGIAPTALNSTAITATSANYTWTPGGLETAWDVYYGPQPLTAPTTTTAPTATTSAASYSMTGLTQSTGYDIYVRANCGGGVYSPWTAATTFTTLTTCPAPGSLTITAITPTTAVANWTANGPATTWFVKYSAPTTTASVSGTPSYTLAGLMPSVNYTVQARAFCGVGDTSKWTPELVFTTQCFAPAPATSNSSQCGLGIPTASVSGGTSYKWYATPTSTTILQSGGSATYTNQINATTTWYVSTANGACESTRATVTASVTPTDAVTATASSSIACPGSQVTLTAVQSGNTNVYSYTWTASPAANSGIPTSATGASLNVFPTAPGTYVYNLNASDGICNAASSVSVTLNDAPSVNVSATPTVLCSGATGSLSATTNGIAAGNATIGTAITVTPQSAELPTAFCNRFTGYRMQAVYTAAELNAAGLRAGNITSVAFNITGLGSAATNPLYTVRCGTTTLSAFTNFVSNAGFTTVYPPATYTHSVGINVIPFSTPYNWDGVSNLIVELTHDGVDDFNNAPTYYTATAGNTVVFSVYEDATGLLSTMRLNIVFGGQTLTQNSGGLSWQWNPGAINSNTASVTPVNAGAAAATQVYTVTATNPVTTCSNTGTVSILVNPLPSAPLTSNSSQCGLGVPTASVSGGGSYKWYATPTSTTVLQSGTSATYTTSINTTTTWHVSSFNGTCESTRATLTTSVSVPESVTASSTATAICSGETFTLTATKSGTVNTYAYTWTASPAAGSGIPASVSGATTIVAPTATGTYNYLLTAGDGVCTTTASINVSLNSLPDVSNAMATPTAVCSAGSVTLSAISMGVIPGNATVGTSNTTDYYSGPYHQGGTSDNKVQWLYTAAELAAAGIKPGNITAISFNASSGSPAIMNNFTVRMGATTTTAMATNYDADPPVVYGPASVSAAAGVNTYAFAIPFNWDGTSNAIIQICHDNVGGHPGGSTSVSCQTINDRTVFTNVMSACTYTSGTSHFYRPVISFSAQVTGNVTNSTNFVWNPGAISTHTAVVNPANTGTTAATQVYTVTATNPTTGCSNTATTSVVVNPLPAAPAAANSIQCRTAVPTASVTGSGGIYKWYATPTGTTVLQSSSSVTYTTAVSTSTTFYVSEFNGTCEGPRAAVSVTVNTPDAVTATSTSTVACTGQSFTLTATNTGTNNAYSYTWTATPAAGSGIATSVSGATTSVMPTTPGSRNYKVTAADAMCTTTAVVTVLAASTPFIGTTASPGVICAGSTATLNANSASGGLSWQWNPGAVNSNSITVTPSTPGTLSYTVTAINPATTCSNTSVVTRTVNASPSVSVAASTGSICSGTTASLTASGATTYSWMPAGGSASVAVVSPAASTVYTVTGTASGCSNSQTLSLSVTPTPTVTASASPGVICAGATTSLTATGATTYSWMPNGSTSGTTIATPTVSTTYTISGATAGCSNTKTFSVTVNHVPTLTVAVNPLASVLCTTGATATLTASGTSTAYAWSNGATTATTSVAPTSTTVYSVVGTNSCGTKTMTTSITVAKTPTISASSSASVICINNPAVLTASATPGVIYAWNTGASTASISVTPTMTITYTVTGTNACGTATATVVQSVNLCIGLEEVTNAGGIIIYPNPANDYVNIAVPANLASTSTSVEVTDALGKLVMKENINTDVTTLEITKLEDGVYFIRVISNNQTVKVSKVVKH